MKKITFTILLALNFLVLFAQTCPTDAIIMSATISGDTSASATIETQNNVVVVVNGPTTFSAPTVTLKPGFCVPAGQTFTAETTGCTNTPPVNSCSNPVIFTCGQTYAGNNITNGANVWESYFNGGSPISNYTGKEVIHTLDIPANTTTNLTLDGLTQDLALFVYATCTNQGSWIAASDKIGNSAPETVTINPVATSRTVYIIVDGWGAAASNYNLSCTQNSAPLQSPIASSRNSKGNSRIAASHAVDFEIHPNPATQFVNLKYTMSSDASIAIDLYNMTGARLKTLLPLQEKSKGLHQTKVDVSAFDAGMYYVMLRQEGQIQTKKLVIAK